MQRIPQYSILQFYNITSLQLQRQYYNFICGLQTCGRSALPVEAIFNACISFSFFWSVEQQTITLLKTMALTVEEGMLERFTKIDHGLIGQK